MAVTQVVFISISSKSFLENFSYLLEVEGWRLEAGGWRLMHRHVLCTCSVDANGQTIAILHLVAKFMVNSQLILMLLSPRKSSLNLSLKEMEKQRNVHQIEDDL